MKLHISDIQPFSVGDGPGIRTTVFFKGCNLYCPWCHNPETQSFSDETLRYETRNENVACGRWTEAEFLLPLLLEDEAFYAQSGGGVTLSGGEVLLQADGAAALSRLLKERDVSVLIDTAGCVPYTAFEKVNPFVDGYLFDYKTASREAYAAIGGDLDMVEENLRCLSADGMQVWVRIPLIPGFNTDISQVRAICSRLQALGVREVHLLPFHRLGSGKYAALGRDYAYKDTQPLTAEELGGLQMEFAQYFQIKTEG